jgi:hypothetical protein
MVASANFVFNSGGAETSQIDGVTSVVANNGKFNKISGFNTGVTNTSTDAANNDIYGFVGMLNNSGVIDGFSGFQIDAYNTGTINGINGLQLDMWLNGGTQTAVKGIDIGGEHAWQGTSTNMYGIYIDESVNIGTGDNYAIYSNTLADSYFKGKLKGSYFNPDSLNLEDVFVWANDTILKDSLAYFDIKPDSVRLRYIDGTYSKWYWTGDKVKEVVGDSLENYVTSNIGLTPGYMPVADAARNLKNSPIYTDGTNVGIGTTSPSTRLEILSPGTGGIPLRLIRNSNAVNYGSIVEFALLNSSSVITPYADLYGGITTNTAGLEDGFLQFRVKKAGTITNALRIDKDGNVGIGTTTGINSKLTFASSTTAAGGILFGSDVNLYRSATNVLKTDDTFNANLFQIAGTELKLDHLKSGSIGLVGTIPVSAGASSTPVWKSLADAGVQDTLTFYETVISVDDDVGHTVPFVLRSTAHVWFNGTLLKQDDWTGVGTTELTILGNVKIYDYIKIQN